MGPWRYLQNISHRTHGLEHHLYVSSEHRLLKHKESGATSFSRWGRITLGWLSSSGMKVKTLRFPGREKQDVGQGGDRLCSHQRRMWRVGGTNELLPRDLNTDYESGREWTQLTVLASLWWKLFPLWLGQRETECLTFQVLCSAVSAQRTLLCSTEQREASFQRNNEWDKAGEFLASTTLSTFAFSMAAAKCMVLWQYLVPCSQQPGIYNLSIPE